MGAESILMEILMWPSELAKNFSLPCAAVTLGVPYLLYGLPSLQDGLQPLAMWYGVAGVSYVGYERLASGTSSAVRT